MHNTVLVLVFTLATMNSWAFSMASIDVLFQGSPESNVWDYRIPNGDDQPMDQLRVLADAKIQSACLNGSPQKVMANIDSLLKEPGVSIAHYEWTATSEGIHLKIQMTRERPAAELNLAACK